MKMRRAGDVKDQSGSEAIKQAQTGDSAPKEHGRAQQQASASASDSYVQVASSPTQAQWEAARVEAAKIARILLKDAESTVFQGRQPAKIDFPLTEDQIEMFKRIRDSI